MVEIEGRFMFSYLLLCNKFPQNLVALNNNIYYLTIFVSQEFRHGLAGLSGSGSFTELQSWCWPVI